MILQKQIKGFREWFGRDFRRAVNEEIATREDAARSLKEMLYVLYATAFLACFIFVAVLSLGGLPGEILGMAPWGYLLLCPIIFVSGSLLDRYKSRAVALILYGCYLFLIFSCDLGQAISLCFYLPIFIYIVHIVFQYHKLPASGLPLTPQRNKGKRSFAVLILALFVVSGIRGSGVAAVPFALKATDRYIYASSAKKIAELKEYVKEHAEEKISPGSQRKIAGLLQEFDARTKKFYQTHVKSVPASSVAVFALGVLSAILYLLVFYNIICLRKIAFCLFWCASLAMASASLIAAHVMHGGMKLVLLYTENIAEIVAIVHQQDQFVQSSIEPMGFWTLLTAIFIVPMFVNVLMPLYLLTRPETRSRFQ